MGENIAAGQAETAASGEGTPKKPAESELGKGCVAAINLAFKGDLSLLRQVCLKKCSVAA